VAYNETLVERGRFWISPEFFFEWAQELERMNAGKEGGRYQYPESFMLFLKCVRIGRGLDVRGLEGFCRQLIENVKPALAAHGMPASQTALLKAPDYSTIWRRTGKAKIDPEAISLLESDEDYDVALDSSGVKVTNRGEWKRRKYGPKRGQKDAKGTKVEGGRSRGWVRVHVGVNAQTKQSTGVRVTQEAVGDAKSGQSILRQSSNRIRAAGARPRRAMGDGGYDARDVFNAARDKGFRSVFKVAKNASTKPKGSRERARRVREFQALGYRDWAGFLGYGDRWCVEGKFSSTKRMFGEHLQSRTWPRMQDEARHKILLHDALLAWDRTKRGPWSATA
jgi:hypothetical protein